MISFNLLLEPRIGVRGPAATSILLRSFTAVAIVCLVLAGGCARGPATGETSIKAKTLSEVEGSLRNNKATLDEFRLRGPFATTIHKDFELRLSAKERIDSDLYLSAPAEKAPLVIFLHGNDSSKDSHAFQAMHLASWGMHALALQLSNNGHWIENGKTLARVVDLIRRAPEIIDTRIDVNKIILVGHSFGASSVVIALAEGAPAAGGILLDPAVYGNDLPRSLRKVRTPLMVIGADEHVFTARNRDYFFHYIPRSVAEVSIKDASHEDAQYPGDQAFGSESNTTEELQITFVSALTSAAFSLATTGALDYAWTTFDAVLKDGTFINAKKK